MADQVEVEVPRFRRTSKRGLPKADPAIDEQPQMKRTRLAPLPDARPPRFFDEEAPVATVCPPKVETGNEDNDELEDGWREFGDKWN